jgi:Family of unknown function (DUF6049)
VRLIGATIAVLAALSGSVATAGSLQAAAPAPSAASIPSVAVHGAAPAATGSKGLELGLTAVAPAAVDADKPLVVSGTVRNNGTKAVKNVEVALRLRGQPLDSRQDINDWLGDGELWSFDRTLARTAKPATIAPGTTMHFTLTVPAGEMHLPIADSAFGPRGITLVAQKADDELDSDPLDVLRSTIVWAPTELLDRTRLSIVVPITTTSPSIEAGQPTSDVAASVLTGGRLQRVVQATKDPAIAWAVDPAVLASVQRLITNGINQQTTDQDDDSDDPVATSDSPSASGSSAGGTPSPTASPGPDQNDAAKVAAQTWLSEFERGQPGRTVLGLPFADPDLTSLLNTKGALTLLRHSDALGQAETLKVLGVPLDTTVAWPGDGKVTPAALSALARTGRTAVLLSSGNQRPDPDIDYTPTGHSDLRGNGKSLSGLLYDEQLSALATASGGVDAALDTQTLLAQLAAITMERPDDVRQVLAVMPRTWSPAPAGVQTMMTALHAAPWVSLSSLSNLRKATGPPRDAPTYQRTAVKAQLPVGTITGALALSRNLDAFGSALSDPDPILQPLREQVASLLSVAWRSDREHLSDARLQVADNVDQLVGGVRLLIGTKRPIFTARSAPLQMTVDNDTIYPVSVMVRLTPQSGQLTFDATKVFTAPPKQRSVTLIKAHALANGNVVVEAVLVTKGGKALGPSHTFTVRARPNWESRGMVVAGGFLGLLLVVGLLRGIRHRRPSVPPESVPDVDDLASQRAEHPPGSSNELLESAMPSALARETP